MRQAPTHRSRSAGVVPRDDPSNRSLFLESDSAVALAQSRSLRAAFAQDGWRTFETVTRVDVRDSFGVARAWVPLPLEADSNWQKTIGSSWSGNASQAQILHDGKYGVAMLYAEWPAREANPYLEGTSRFMTRDPAGDFSRPDRSLELSAADRKFFTPPTELIPTDRILLKPPLYLTKTY